MISTPKLRKCLSRISVIMFFSIASFASLLTGEAFATWDHYQWNTSTIGGNTYSQPTIGSTTCGATCGYLQSVDNTNNGTSTSGASFWESYCQNTSTNAWETDSAGSGGFGQFGTPGNYSQKVVSDCANGSPWVFRGVCVANTGFYFTSSSNPTLGTTGAISTFSYPSNFCTNPANLQYCANTDFSGATVSYVGTTVSVRFKYTNPTLPPIGHWNVIIPDTGNSSSTPQGQVLTSATVDGFPNYYYATFTLSSLTNFTARIVAPDDGTLGSGCYVSTTVSSSAISSTPDSGEGDTGADTATSSNPNCGWTLNLFRVLKCLFEPSSSVQQWNDLRTTAQARPPFSLIASGIPYVTGLSDYMTSNYSETCGVVGHDCPPAFDDPSVTGAAGSGGSSHSLDLITSAGNIVQGNTWGGLLYGAMTAGVWGVFLLIMWRRLSASFGGKG